MTQLAIAALLYCTPMKYGQFTTTPRAQQVCRAKFLACGSRYTDVRDIITCVRKAQEATLIVVTGR